MTETPGDSRKWQQPEWDRTADAEQDPPNSPGDAFFSSASSTHSVVPLTPPPPPTLFESGLRVATGIAWPVAIALAVLGYGDWILNLALAFVFTALFSSTATELKRRRKRQT